MPRTPSLKRAQRSAFWSGFWSALDLSAIWPDRQYRWLPLQFRQFELHDSSWRDDAEAIGRDWQAVGDDMREAARRLGEDH